MACFGDRLPVELKADATPVTKVDRAAERAIRSAIAVRDPAAGVLGEEEGSKEGANGRRWVIDPVDGTKLFAEGIPLWTTLIGLEIDGEAVLGWPMRPRSARRYHGGRARAHRPPPGRPRRRSRARSASSTAGCPPRRSSVPSTWIDHPAPAVGALLGSLLLPEDTGSGVMEGDRCADRPFGGPAPPRSPASHRLSAPPGAGHRSTPWSPRRRGPRARAPTRGRRSDRVGPRPAPRFILDDDPPMRQLDGRRESGAHDEPSVIALQHPGFLHPVRPPAMTDHPVS